jgi:hypothetical protein
MTACIFTDGWTPKDYLTILLAVIATWIAYQQLLTNELKVQHDLYERKFAVFTALIDFLNAVVVKGLQADNQSLEIRSIFLIKTRESNFLFKGSEIPVYLDEIFNKAEDFGIKYVGIFDNPKLSKQEQIAAIDKEGRWLREQLKWGAKDKFVKYIKLYSSWRG